MIFTMAIYVALMGLLASVWEAPPPTLIDEEFKSYIAEYKKLTNTEFNMSVTLRSNRYFAGKTIGTCYRLAGRRINNNYIFIKREFWNKQVHSQREQLIFHELHHCVKWAEHDDKTYRSYKAHIMSSQLIPVNDYVHFRDGYIEEMQTGNAEKTKSLIDKYINTSASMYFLSIP